MQVKLQQKTKLKMKTIRCYRDLRRLETFEERFEYLNLKGFVGKDTFGFDRWINQQFYMSREWRSIRQAVIIRDDGCDLGIAGREIHEDLLIHHMNPITKDQLIHRADEALDIEFLICTTKVTHNAIHYGTRNSLRSLPADRRPGDTRLW
jgi:hypothetical protein